MLRKSCDELEADLQETYGLQLGDLWVGLISVRRVAVLASQLPPGARVWQSENTDAMWTPQDYWLADIIDAIHSNSWIVANRGVPSGQTSPKPKQVDRPKDLRDQIKKDAMMELNARRFQQAWNQRKNKEG